MDAIYFRAKCILFFLYIPFLNAAEHTEFNALGKPMSSSNYIGDKYQGESFYGGRYTYGMRKNAVVSTFIANNSNPLNVPVLGLGSVSALAGYLDRDSVALYAENNSPPFKSWEKIESPKITPTSVSDNKISPDNIKVGMIIETISEPKWATYVVSVKQGKITTAGWINLETKHMGTPENGTSLVVNPITKIWATNFNLIFPSNGRANKGVIQENGVINNSVNKKVMVNGVDTVILPQSKAGGNMAYLARSTSFGNAQRWEVGFASIGNKISFSSRDNRVNSPDISFYDESKSRIGFLFNGNNTAHSLAWKNGDVISASLSPTGQIEKINFKTKLIKNTVKLTSDIGRYMISASRDITLTLPNEGELTDGYTLKLTNISQTASIINLTSESGKSINGTHEFAMKSGGWNVEAIYFDNEWIIQ
ncbi:hypothetical protein [Raoultella planticola]|uniref:hypothetical protein n=1 Tax=Raoultella planticola TaxID=575 RepID=UPI001F531810|nr:hypothetical protein [Raoultella planticola]UNK74398.1 hypothetical protein MNO12_23315 [Raoultella planticola]